MTFLYPSRPLLLFPYVTIGLCNCTKIMQQSIVGNPNHSRAWNPASKWTDVHSRRRIKPTLIWLATIRSLINFCLGISKEDLTLVRWLLGGSITKADTRKRTHSSKVVVLRLLRPKSSDRLLCFYQTIKLLCHVVCAYHGTESTEG